MKKTYVHFVLGVVEMGLGGALVAYSLYLVCVCPCLTATDRWLLASGVSIGMTLIVLGGISLLDDWGGYR